MGLNDKPSSERLHIGFFGLRNAGKSSVVNAITGQSMSLVSEVKGTTTDPVQKVMELLPLGPVVIIDTPGIDDEGSLGKMRADRARRMLDKTDIAVLVVDATKGIQETDKELCEIFKKRKLPYIIAYNKCDLVNPEGLSKENEINISAKKGFGIYELKEFIGKITGNFNSKKLLVGDLVEPHDVVVLVTPIDESAPKGRMILPQQQVIRDIIDVGAISLVTKDTELSLAMSSLVKPPKIVITDSQVFGKANEIVPDNVLLTSFSILFARYKGELEQMVLGAMKLSELEDGDVVLISESCTHHRQCNDIGSVKLPGWITEYTHKNLYFEFTSGGDFPDNLEKYSLIVHCGACMINKREMNYRINCAQENHVSITNYGIAIAKMHGILERSLSPFPELIQKIKLSKTINNDLC